MVNTRAFYEFLKENRAWIMDYANTEVKYLPLLLLKYNEFKEDSKWEDEEVRMLILPGAEGIHEFLKKPPTTFEEYAHFLIRSNPPLLTLVHKESGLLMSVPITVIALTNRELALEICENVPHAAREEAREIVKTAITALKEHFQTVIKEDIARTFGEKP